MKPVSINFLGLAFVLASLTIAAPVRAHPHVWTTVETEIQMGPNNEILGFKHKWTFDELYSQFAIDGLDTNKDGIYSEEELKPLAQANIESLKEFEYFTFPFLGTVKLALKDPTDSRLEYRNKMLTLTFVLPLAEPLPAAKIKDFTFSVYDPGMYVAMSFEKGTGVTVSANAKTRCTPSVGNRPQAKEGTLAKLGESIDPSSNVGSQFAERVSIKCKS
jgi:ABC-type uncharacterized transport system substrate-binding protein